MTAKKTKTGKADIPLWKPQKAPSWSAGDAPIERARRARVKRQGGAR